MELMVHASVKQEHVALDRSELYSNKPILKRILHYSTLVKIIVLVILGIIDYFLIAIYPLYENSAYRPIIVILIITVFFLSWVF